LVGKNHDTQFQFRDQGDPGDHSCQSAWQNLGDYSKTSQTGSKTFQFLPPQLLYVNIQKSLTQRILRPTRVILPARLTKGKSV
jgi:hypothetical protein